MLQIWSEISIINLLLTLSGVHLHSSPAFSLNGFIIYKLYLGLVGVMHDTKQLPLVDHVVGTAYVKEASLIHILSDKTKTKWRSLPPHHNVHYCLLFKKPSTYTPFHSGQTCYSSKIVYRLYHFLENHLSLFLEHLLFLLEKHHLFPYLGLFLGHLHWSHLL